MAIATNIMDLRAQAMKKVPRAIFDYADRGSYDEITIDRNRREPILDKGRAWVRATLSPEAVGERLETLYRSMIRAA